MKLIKILKILEPYLVNLDYPIFAEHDVIGFMANYGDISFEDMAELRSLGVFYDEGYDSLIMFV